MQMLSQIIANTPGWVFVVFVLLLVLGLQQMRPGRASLRRVSILPLGMAAYSLYGVVSSFGAAPAALAGWLAGLVTCVLLVLRRPVPHGVRFDAAARSFTRPGSVVPLALMMGIFFAKYAAGVTLTIAPQVAGGSAFALALSLLYGGFSGVFLGRAARLWKVAGAERPRNALNALQIQHAAGLDEGHHLV